MSKLRQDKDQDPGSDTSSNWDEITYWAMVTICATLTVVISCMGAGFLYVTLKG